jgi:hypothetical protein
VNRFEPTPSTVNKGWFYHSEYPDKFSEYPDVRSIRTEDWSIRLSASRILVKDRLNFYREISWCERLT